MALTLQQAQFAAEYLVDLNATQAAIRAGYSEKTAKSQGSRLLTIVDVQLAVHEGIKSRSERTEISQDYVLRTIMDTIDRCQQGKQVMNRQGEIVMVETPTGELAPAYEFDAASVLKGCDLLARHLGMFKTDNEQGKERLVIVKDFTGEDQDA